VEDIRGLIPIRQERRSRLDGVRARVALGVTASLGVGLAAMVAAIFPSVSPASRAVANPAPSGAPLIRPIEAKADKPEPVVQGESAQRFTGTVGNDLSKALLTAGVPQLQGREYVALLGRAIPLASGLSVDDRFDLIVLRNPDGSLGQLAYAGLDRVARSDLELMKWTDGKHVIWVNADGVGGDGSQALRMPVQGHLTSGFGERFHPILGYERFHDGVDLGAPQGTPIVAAADGRVVSAGWAGGYGRAVEIAHAGGVETRYGHMSRIAAYSGEQVHRGDVIGYVGSTGLSTGPHLHFEVMKNGRPVNPMSVKAIAGGPGQLQGAQLIAFHGELRKLLLGHG